MTRRFDGRVAVVFGAGSVGPGWGNGKAAAVQYARDGASVAAIDIVLAAADETVGIIRGEGGTAHGWRCDVTKRDEIVATVASIVERFGRIDVLHNNVGLPAMGTTESLTAWTHEKEGPRTGSQTIALSTILQYQQDGDSSRKASRR